MAGQDDREDSGGKSLNSADKTVVVGVFDFPVTWALAKSFNYAGIGPGRSSKEAFFIKSLQKQGKGFW